MKIKEIRLVFLTTLGIVVATTFIRYQSVVADIPISFTLFLVATWFLIYRKVLSIKQVFCSFSLSLLFLQIAATLIDGALPSIGLPNIIVSFFGIIAACVWAGKTIAMGIKVLIPIAIYIFSFWYIIGGYNYWFNFLGNATFTGKVNIQMPKGWYTYSEKQDTFDADFYLNKIVLLDFWNTSCGVCFKKFPELENLYQKHRQEKNFILQSVNIPISRDTLGMAFKMVDQKNRYSFPVVVGNEEMRAAFNISAYPTVLLIDHGKVIFRGRLELVEKVLSEALSRR